MNIIFIKNFIMFVINFLLNCLILLVLIMKILLIIQNKINLQPYIDNQYHEFFPVNYYVPIENYIFYLEILMIAIILINLLNSFYFEFYARIFLTFKYAYKYLIAYLVIFLISILGFSTATFVLYGRVILSNNIIYNQILLIKIFSII